MTTPESDPELLGWGAKQGHILTGAGELEKLFVPGRDYKHPEDLPHHLKTQGATDKVYSKWKREGRTSQVVVGAWNRPLFCGGWKESTNADTVVYNLQTPSLFIDLRFPLKRPDYANHGGFHCLTLDQLRCLSRQHCFAGYSLVSDNDKLCIRHHAIDWNYHPSFPRSRPNKWTIQAKADGKSFKEFGFARDSTGQAVYMERWQIYPEGKGPYLALKKKIGDSPGDCEEMLIVVGNHFAYARDRSHPLPSFGSRGGGCTNLVDWAWKAKERKKMEQMLDLEGSYGTLRPHKGVLSWKIKQSTLPWREGKSLFAGGKPPTISTGSDGALTVSWRNAEWTVYENSFTRQELLAMFALRSKL